MISRTSQPPDRKDLVFLYIYMKQLHLFQMMMQKKIYITNHPNLRCQQQCQINTGEGLVLMYIYLRTLSLIKHGAAGKKPINVMSAKDTTSFLAAAPQHSQSGTYDTSFYI